MSVFLDEWIKPLKLIRYILTTFTTLLLIPAYLFHISLSKQTDEAFLSIVKSIGGDRKLKSWLNTACLMYIPLGHHVMHDFMTSKCAFFFFAFYHIYIFDKKITFLINGMLINKGHIEFHFLNAMFFNT